MTEDGREVSKFRLNAAMATRTDMTGSGMTDIEWLSSKEAARRLGITQRTLYRLIDEGQLPAYKLGRVIRLQQAEVDAFIEAARIRPGELEHLYPHADADAD